MVGRISGGPGVWVISGRSAVCGLVLFVFVQPTVPFGLRDNLVLTHSRRAKADRLWAIWLLVFCLPLFHLDPGPRGGAADAGGPFEPAWWEIRNTCVTCAVIPSSGATCWPGCCSTME